MLKVGDRVRPLEYCQSLLFREGIIHEIWNTEQISSYVNEYGGKKPTKGEVWYRVLFDAEYEPEGEEIDENGDMVVWSDNLITFGESEIEVING